MGTNIRPAFGFTDVSLVFFTKRPAWPAEMLGSMIALRGHLGQIARIIIKCIAVEVMNHLSGHQRIIRMYLIPYISSTRDIGTLDPKGYSLFGSQPPEPPCYVARSVVVGNPFPLEPGMLWSLKTMALTMMIGDLPRNFRPPSGVAVSDLTGRQTRSSFRRETIRDLVATGVTAISPFTVGRKRDMADGADVLIHRT